MTEKDNGQKEQKQMCMKTRTHSCDNCDFRANTGPELKKHVSFTHHRAASWVKPSDAINVNKNLASGGT